MLFAFEAKMNISQMVKCRDQISFRKWYEYCISNRLVKLLLVALLPAATKLWPRLSFYSCLWFCSQGGSASVHAGIPPAQEGDPLGRRPTIPPRRRPPGKEAPPGRRLPWHTVNERPVRILLECIVVGIWIFT